MRTLRRDAYDAAPGVRATGAGGIASTRSGDAARLYGVRGSKELLSHMIGFSEEMNGGRQDGFVEAARFRAGSSSSAPAQAFLGAGLVCTGSSRLRLADGAPMAIEIVQMPVSLCPGLERFGLRGTIVVPRARVRLPPLQLGRCEQVVAAAIPDNRQRSLLEIGAKVALLTVTRHSYISPDRPAAYSGRHVLSRRSLYGGGERRAQTDLRKALMQYRWELLLWLWLAFFFNQADRQVFNVVLPALGKDLF